jgi:hypothetical protein
MAQHRKNPNIQTPSERKGKRNFVPLKQPIPIPLGFNILYRPLIIGVMQRKKKDRNIQ